MADKKSTLSNSVVLAFCCIGILGSYLAYGVIQEQLFVIPSQISHKEIICDVVSKELEHILSLDNIF